MSKYHSRKVTVDGITFDSIKESNRYEELKLLERAGVITGLRLQVKFVLIPAQHDKTEAVYTKGKLKGQRKPGKLLERECSYYADFVYERDDNPIQYVTEVVFSIQDGQWGIKRLFPFNYDVITPSDDKEFYTMLKNVAFKTYRQINNKQAK